MPSPEKRLSKGVHANFREAGFDCVIADRLAGLKAELAEECERLAKEREKGLRAEIDGLRKDNADLRNQLQVEQRMSVGLNTRAEQDSALAPDVKAPNGKHVATSDGADAESTQELAAESKAAEIAQLADATEKGSQEAVVAQPEVESFQLVAELLNDPWHGGTSLNEDSRDSASMVMDGVQEKRGTISRRTVFSMKKKFVLDPTSQTKLCWDVVGIPILAWDLVTIPLQVFDIGPSGDTVIDGTGWVTLLYWTLDTVVTFFTAIFDKHGGLVTDHMAIAKNYLKGPFPLDLLIILADWLTVLIEAIGNDAHGVSSNLSVLRVLRISRFARLIRVRKLKSKLQTVKDRIDNEWVLVIASLISKVMSILVVNHYVSCGWYWIGCTKTIDDEPTNRWLTSFPYPQYGLNRGVLSEATWHYQYLTSLHWAVAQFTPGPQNIQPQNSLERLYAIFILLFGMIVFSYFIASLTQARMQLNKMMSNLERDNWLLRRFCHQHNVSRELTTHMQRYIDLVIIPNYHKLAINDVVLLPKLSPHLRAQLNTELVSQHLVVHPFLKQLQVMNRATMHGVCNRACEQLPLARSDVAFNAGEKAHFMIVVTAGVLDYIPLAKESAKMHMHPDHWCCEAVLWTRWTHQGQLQASIESMAMSVNAAPFRTVLQDNGFVLSFARIYGIRFCERLTDALHQTGPPSDLHDQLAWDICIEEEIQASPSTKYLGRIGHHRATTTFGGL